MRLVDAPGELAQALTSAKREAQAAFGNDQVLIEKYLASARHIEVQVFGDSHGNIVSLYERECTLQRRHQKVVEEAPSIAITPKRRAEMSAAARAAAQAVGYLGAGTVEFIADSSEFYFIEMNTRLQVEHPVTEMILGMDLVEWQLRAAFGEKLPLSKSEITANGHAIEARIYAEDAQKGFLPSTGVIRNWREPVGEGIRVDSGFRAGDAVTPYYDPLLAKLIVWGQDRATALLRMEQALGQFEIIGVTNNLAFLRRLVGHPQVASGNIDTGFIERELSKLTAAAPVTALDMAAACAAVLQREAEERIARRDNISSPWQWANGWMLAGRRSRHLSFGRGAQRFEPIVWYGRDGLSLEFAGAEGPLRFTAGEAARFEITLDAATETVSAIWSAHDLDLTTPRGHFQLHWIDPFAPELGEAAAASRIVAPMPGTVTRVLAEPGADLARGAPLLVLEAMKMEHTLRAPGDGRLKALKCTVGDFVQEGTELADFELASD